MKNIKFLDLSLINSIHKHDFIRNINSIFKSGSFLFGKYSDDFEKKFANFCNVKYTCSVGSGLDALYFLLHAHNIGPGDEVIIPTNTFIATYLSVVRTGALPVLAEPNAEHFNLSDVDVEKKITKRTKAIIFVHLYGNPSGYNSIKKIAQKNNIYLFEDAAQAHGAKIDNRHVGSLGNGAAFSFYPGKILGSIGDAGAVTSNNKKIIQTIKKLKNYGSNVKYKHEIIGYNSRLDDLQASFLLLKLKNINNELKLRRNQAKTYLKLLDDKKFILPKCDFNSLSSWHLFVIRTKNRKKFMDYMRRKKIDLIIHYPIPIYKQKCYLQTKRVLSYPVTDTLSREVVSLPIGSHLTLHDIKNICKIANDF